MRKPRSGNTNACSVTIDQPAPPELQISQYQSAVLRSLHMTCIVQLPIYTTNMISGQPAEFKPNVWKARSWCRPLYRCLSLEYVCVFVSWGELVV